MAIIINGQQYDDLSGLSLLELLDKLRLSSDKIAIELNREIVPKSLYGNTVLQDGDKLEIITFIGGG